MSQADLSQHTITQLGNILVVVLLVAVTSTLGFISLFIKVWAVYSVGLFTIVWIVSWVSTAVFVYAVCRLSISVCWFVSFCNVFISVVSYTTIGWFTILFVGRVSWNTVCQS